VITAPPLLSYLAACCGDQLCNAQWLYCNVSRFLEYGSSSFSMRDSYAWPPRNCKVAISGSQKAECVACNKSFPGDAGRREPDEEIISWDQSKRQASKIISQISRCRTEIPKVS
jgi:hypothetical protein